MNVAILPSKVYWFTGLPGAGKTTLAHAIVSHYATLGQKIILLDGDEMRTHLCAGLGFSAVDRLENVRRVAAVAKLIANNGIPVICALVTPTEVLRQTAAELIGGDLFRLVHINTSLAICEHRDPKGMYAKARRGEIAQFTGISDVFEIPKHTDLVLGTTGRFIEQTLADFVWWATG